MSILISIIIPTYNRAHLISQALDSLLHQSYQNWEAIIIDDCSLDNTEDIVSEYLKDNRFRYFKNEINKERSFSRNKGVSLALGDYICFLDSDDYLFEDALHGYYDLLIRTKEEYDVIYSNYKFLMPDKTYQDFTLEREAEIFTQSIFYHGHLSAINLLIRKRIALLVKFDDTLMRNEDLEFNIRLVLATQKFIHLDRFTYCAVEHAERSIHDRGQYDKTVKGYTLLIQKWISHSDYKYLNATIKKRLLDHSLVQLLYIHNREGNSRQAILSNLKRVRYDFSVVTKWNFYRAFLSILFKGLKNEG